LAGAAKRIAVTQPTLQPVDQHGLLAGLAAQLLDLGAQRHLAFGPASAAAWRPRPPRVVSVVVSRSIWAFCCALIELASSRALLCRLAPAVSSAISRSRLNSSRFGLVEPRLHARQLVGNRLLQDAPGVLVLFQVGLELHHVGFQRRDAGLAAVDLDQLAGALELGLVELRLELVHLDGVLRPQAVAVGLDLGLAHGIDCLMRAVVSRTARDQKADATSSPSRLAPRNPRATSMAD
jgi:hypothetical protein